MKIADLFRNFNLWRWRRHIMAALALHRRGEARKDGLTLVTARASVEICWRARAPHPWDCHPDEKVQTAVFATQALHDTESALQRLFEATPETELIELTVLDRDCDRVIIEGRVSRCDFQDMTSTSIESVRMRIKRIGLREYLSAGQ